METIYIIKGERIEPEFISGTMEHCAMAWLTGNTYKDRAAAERSASALNDQNRKNRKYSVVEYSLVKGAA